jgi:hypothetical protein
VRQIFNNVAFIVFNYDRCLEYFLLHALQYLFGISDTEAYSILDDLTIIHPFGDIGPLTKIPFGGTDNLNDLQCIPIAPHIQTYTEAAAGSKHNEIQDEVARAQCFVFLGFALHPEAMRLLMPANPLPTLPRVFATALGMSDDDAVLVSQQIASMGRPASTPLINTSAQKSKQVQVGHPERRLIATGTFVVQNSGRLVVVFLGISHQQIGQIVGE